MEISDLIQSMGVWFYGLVLIWTFLEGETIVIVSGIAARAGDVHLGFLLASAWIGSLLGDQTMFLIGRYAGPQIFNRFPRLHAPVLKAAVYLERHSIAFILFYRFLYGVRNVSALAISQSNISLKKFFFLNILSSGIWAVAFTAGGYMAGAALLQIVGSAAVCGKIILIGLILCLALAFTLHFRKHSEKIPE